MAIDNETKILEKQMKLLPVQSTESNWAGMDPKRVIRPPLWQREGKVGELWSHLNLMEWISLRK